MDVRARINELVSSKGSTPEPERLRSLFDLNWAWTLEESPESATFTGQSGAHDRWTDKSFEALERRKAEVRAQRDVLSSIERDKLDDDDKLNLDIFARLLDDQIEHEQFNGDFLAMDPRNGLQTFVPMLLSMMPATTEKRCEDIIGRLRALPALIEQTIALCDAGISSGTVYPRAIYGEVAELIGHQADDDPETSPLLEGIRKIPADLPARARVQADAATILREHAAPAFRKLHDYIVERYTPALRDSIAWTDLPDGDEWYAFLARHYTTTDMTPKEIHEIGLSEVARIRSEMDDAIREANFEGSFEEFAEFLRTDKQFYFDDAQSLLVAYRDIAKRADAELPRLFGKLPRLPYGVQAVPAYSEQNQTTAYYLPGSPEAGRAGSFFANTYNLAARPKWEMEALSLHEAVPGHHLQIALSLEMENMPEFRRWEGFTAFIEGWGLYSESLGTEMGFYTDPYSRFGQLTYEMWRAIRLVVDTGMHALGWTRAQAIDLFKEKTGKTEHDIVVEVDRYIGWAGQALAYKIGELKFKELRARATKELGERFDVRAFHDVLLSAGALPLEVLEARVDGWITAAGR